VTDFSKRASRDTTPTIRNWPFAEKEALLLLVCLACYWGAVLNTRKWKNLCQWEMRPILHNKRKEVAQGK
jgi:hypothetical protein